MIASPLRVYAPIPSRVRFVHDGDEAARKRLLFHVESGDYFATLATYLMLLKDQLDDAIVNRTPPTNYQSSLLQTMHDDLVYLAQHWSVKPKNHQR